MTPPDPRTAQAERAADYMERHPAGVTLAELGAACDLGSSSKVVSDMAGPLGYGIRRAWRHEPCRFGKGARRRRVYILTGRPTTARQLPLPWDR